MVSNTRRYKNAVLPLAFFVSKMETKRLRNRGQWITYLNKYWWPVATWPKAIRDIMWDKNHPQNQQRFKLIVFLLNNGLKPDYTNWLLTNSWNFDYEGIRHIEWLIKTWIQEPKRWKSWDMTLRRTN